EEGRREGIQEGIERGLEEGRREGMQEGIEKGIQEGIRKEQINIARSLKKAGIDIKIISENTGLSVEEVLKL
ncbi:Yae1 family protein, partial [Brachyspira murdochii]|uniref:Yae1 family protein n=1 Tax=Brachyspira murdochii TaxID=84378 RepID=UPI0030076831